MCGNGKSNIYTLGTRVLDELKHTDLPEGTGTVHFELLLPHENTGSLLINHLLFKKKGWKL